MMRSSDSKLTVLIWSLPVLVPFLLVFFSYVFDVWSWGLMDDLSILACGTDIFSRWQKYFFDLILWGVFRPIFVLHTAIFYSLFASFPKGFYILKLFEVLLILLLWGWAGYRITGKKICFWLIPTITLSFHYFYDVLFYPSSHEFLGLLGVGIALHCCISAWQEIILGAVSMKRFYGFLIGCIFCLLFAFGSKETFVSSGMAIGISLFLGSQLKGIQRFRKPLFFSGLGIIVFTIIYAISLKIFIQAGYTSTYQWNNIERLWVSLFMWVKKDFTNHIPWIVFMLWAVRGQVKDVLIFNKEPDKAFLIWGMIVGVFMYLGFLAILLPWCTTSYYIAPLGLFFAFFVALGTVRIIDAWPISKQLVVVILALMLNILVCSYALSRERSYQADTHNFVQWLKANHEQFISADSSAIVFSNALEPSSTIPAYLGREGVSISQFLYKPLSSADKSMRFYLYSRRFGFVPDHYFEGCKVEFFSKNWILYRK